MRYNSINIKIIETNEFNVSLFYQIIKFSFLYCYIVSKFILSSLVQFTLLIIISLIAIQLIIIGISHSCPIIIVWPNLLFLFLMHLNVLYFTKNSSISNSHGIVFPTNFISKWILSLIDLFPSFLSELWSLLLDFILYIYFLFHYYYDLITMDLVFLLYLLLFIYQ